MMVTNNREYMKAYQRWSRDPENNPDPRKKSVKNIVKNTLISLHPPKMVEKSSAKERKGELTPEPIRRNPEVNDLDQLNSKTFANLDPRYQKWCLSLETQRHYYYTKFDKVYRKDSIEVKKDLKVRNQELDMVELMKKGTIGSYRDCMKELEQVLEMRKK